MDVGQAAAERRVMVIAPPAAKIKRLTGTSVGDAAYHGPIGQIVKSLEGRTEAHPAAIMAHVLAGFGNVIGKGPHILVADTPHHANLFFGVVGPTSAGAKGVSASTPMRVLKSIDPQWDGCILTALSTGEGLIARVAPRWDEESGETIIPDPRLFFLEEEFGRLLTVKGRDGATLGPVLQDAWDGRRLMVPTKRDPLVADQAHISGVVHVTSAELTARLSDVDQKNGFANRFLWLWAERVDSIPRPQPFNLDHPAVGALKQAFRWATDKKGDLTVMWSDEAGAMWDQVYEMLRTPPPGRAGVLLARLAPQVLRLSTIYALADRSQRILPVHLTAALAWREYAEHSMTLIFQSATGHEVADRALDYLREYGEARRTLLYDRVFQRHVTSKDLDEAREVLKGLGLMKVVHLARPEGGRPVEVWRLA